LRRLALVLIVFLSCPILAQRDGQQAGLAVSIRSSKTTYRMGGRTQLEIQLSDVGENAFGFVEKGG
jgi:hypothetical protein